MRSESALSRATFVWLYLRLNCREASLYFASSVAAFWKSKSAKYFKSSVSVYNFFCNFLCRLYPLPHPLKSERWKISYRFCPVSQTYSRVSFSLSLLYINLVFQIFLLEGIESVLKVVYTTNTPLTCFSCCSCFCFNLK